MPPHPHDRQALRRRFLVLGSVLLVFGAAAPKAGARGFKSAPMEMTMSSVVQYPQTPLRLPPIDMPRVEQPETATFALG